MNGEETAGGILPFKNISDKDDLYTLNPWHWLFQSTLQQLLEKFLLSQTKIFNVCSRICICTFAEAMKTFRNPSLNPTLTGCRTCGLIFLNIWLPEFCSKSLWILNRQPSTTPKYKLMSAFEGSCQSLLNPGRLNGH